LIQEDDFLRSEYSHTVRAGLDYIFNPKTTLTGAFTYNIGLGENTNNIRYLEYMNEDEFIGGKNRNFIEKEKEPNIDWNLTFKKSFDKEGQELRLDVDYTYGFEEEIADINETPLGNDIPVNDALVIQNTLIRESQDNLVLQGDYVHPLFAEGKLEVGYKSSIRTIRSDYFVEELQDGIWETLPDFTNKFNYDEGIHAVYATIGNKSGRFSYQAGFRIEDTRIGTELTETGEKNNKEYLNFFPSGHFAYELPGENTLQVSYSRRINRPYYRLLSPFYNFINPYYLRTGNPDLDPEFTHSMELGYMKNWKIASLSSAIYYRHSDGVIQRIQTVNEEGVTIARPENLSIERSYGVELIYSMDPFNWWNLNGSANFFRSQIDGSNLGEDFVADVYSWTARINSRMTVSKWFDFQTMINYRAPQNTTQGRRDAYFYMDLALTRDVLNGRGTASLKLTDVFNSRIYRGVTEGETFYIEQEYRRRTRMVQIGFTFRLNQDKKRGGRNGAGMNGGGDMDF
jgi:outer membrane receptor protein involved in Fe transport